MAALSRSATASRPIPSLRPAALRRAAKVVLVVDGSRLKISSSSVASSSWREQMAEIRRSFRTDWGSWVLFVPPPRILTKAGREARRCGV